MSERGRNRLGFAPPVSLTVTLALLAALGACGRTSDADDGDQAAETTADGGSDGAVTGLGDDASAATDARASEGGNASASNAADHETASDYVWDAAEEVLITLDHTTITTDATRATVVGSTVTITTPGTYRVTGTLDDGRVVVDTSGLVRLILDGAVITSSVNAPLAIMKADKAIVVLASGSSNVLTDPASYVFEAGADEPNAALYSKDDLSIYGLGGSLTIHGNFNDGIGAKDGLVLKDATLAVDAVDDGVRGKSYVVMRGGSLTVTAGGDGVKSDEDEDPTQGFVSIESGTLVVTSAGDGVQAETDTIVKGGTLSITAGGGSGASIADDASAKGLKAGVVVEVTAGTVTVDAADDALHSNTDAWIGGGVLKLASGDQGLKVGDTGSLTIVDGSITVTKSTEAISGGTFTLEGGSLWLKASDDGLSISRGTDAMGDDGSKLYIRGGHAVIDASGDGIDVNGSGEISGGTVIVNGPTGNGNGPLDYNGTLAVSGGLLVAVGSSGMAMAPSTSSTQNSVLVKLASSQAAGALVHLQDGAGADLLTFAPLKAYQSVAFTSPALARGAAYALYTGGSATGTPVDGLYQGGVYTPGTLAESFTTSTSSSVTTVGTSSGGGPGGGGGGRP